MYYSNSQGETTRNNWPVVVLTISCTCTKPSALSQSVIMSPFWRLSLALMACHKAPDIIYIWPTSLQIHKCRPQHTKLHNIMQVYYGTFSMSVYTDLCSHSVRLAWRISQLLQLITSLSLNNNELWLHFCSVHALFLSWLPSLKHLTAPTKKKTHPTRLSVNQKLTWIIFPFTTLTLEQFTMY